MTQAARVKVGQVWIDRLTRAEAFAQIAGLVEAGQGGTVLTPNLDHIVNCEDHAGLRDAYGRASLSLVDSQLLLWSSRFLGTPLPEKLSGSDLVEPLMKFAAERGMRVFLLGGAKGAAARAAEVFQERCGTPIAGFADPMIPLIGGPEDDAIVARIVAARPQLVLVALGSPKQELFMERNRTRLAPAVLLGVGASLDFVAGLVRRAPKWMSRMGLEWFFRLAQEPRRLAHRYLVNDPKFLRILLRTWREPRAERLSERAAERA